MASLRRWSTTFCVLGVVFATPAFERTPRYVIPLAGIVIGGSMSAAARVTTPYVWL